MWFWVCGTTVVCFISCTCFIFDVVRMQCGVYIVCEHVYAMLCTGWYKQCCVNISYAILSIDGAMYMLDMQCCVHRVLCTCCICSVMYVWCCVHVVHLVLFSYGVVCMIVHVVLCTCYTYGVVSRWCYVHVIHRVLCTCGVVYTLYRWYDVRVVLCTRCACGVVYM